MWQLETHTASQGKRDATCVSSIAERLSGLVLPTKPPELNLPAPFLWTHARMWKYTNVKMRSAHINTVRFKKKNSTAQTSRREIWGYERNVSKDDHLLACDVRQFGRMEETFLGWYGKGWSHPVMYNESTEVRINSVWFKNKTAQTSRREIWGYERNVWRWPLGGVWCQAVW